MRYTVQVFLATTVWWFLCMKLILEDHFKKKKSGFVWVHPHVEALQTWEIRQYLIAELNNLCSNFMCIQIILIFGSTCSETENIEACEKNEYQQIDMFK